MKICLFGNYIPDYPRIVVLKKGLLRQGVSIVECHTRARGLKKFLILRRKLRKLKGQYDVLLVGMGGYTLVWWAKFLSKTPVIFDAFVSLYLTNVEDRKLCRPGSLRARYYATLDKLSCARADKVLLDTKAQINYFVNRYSLAKDKFVRVFVGTDNSIFKPLPTNRRPSKKFIIHWHGHIVPFHGLDTVLKAARLLQEEQAVEFRIVTRFNSRYRKVKALADQLGLKNIKFFPETSYQGLAGLINAADLCLGTFGDNAKASVVVPNKLFEAAACGKPIITAKHKVLLEIFTDQKNILFSNPEDPEDLALKIWFLKHNPEIRESLGNKALALFRQTLLPENVIMPIIKVIQ